MSHYYHDYIWKNGFPYGIRPSSDLASYHETCYKIVSDPYNKRVGIEKYLDDKFISMIYDSALFDFRHLKQGEQLAWQKTVVSESSNNALCHIRNQDDRLILIEKYQFKDDLCTGSDAFSPTGILLSKQKILYKLFKDPFNGVQLFDSNDRLVMSKTYAFNEEKRSFSDLLEESWSS